MPRYYRQQSNKNTIKDPRKRSGMIEITNKGLPCPYGARCYRKRWWIWPFQEGGSIEKTIIGKPDEHYHIKKGAQWQ